MRNMRNPIKALRHRIALHHIIRDARRALQAAAAGDCTTGHRITQRVAHRYGPAATLPMALLWCDAIVADMPIPPEVRANAQVRLVFLEASRMTEGPADPSEVPAPVRWTGQVISACAVGDMEMFFALFDALPVEGLERQEHLGELLHMAAASVAGSTS
jgi:hypothetical protein